MVNLINIVAGEKVEAVLPIAKVSDSKYIILATRQGVIKKTAIEKFANIRQSGLTSIKLDTGDQLVWAKTTGGNDQIFLVTKMGKCIRFNETDTRPMGRHTRGSQGNYSQRQRRTYHYGHSSPKRSPTSFRHLMVVTENGVGKRSDVYLYPLQKRGGIGVKVSNLSVKTGNIAATAVVNETNELLILVSKKAITIKLPLKNIPVLSRNTRGVILMRLKTSEDRVNSLTIL